MARNHVFTQRVWQAEPVRRVRHLFSLNRIIRRATARSRSLPDYIIAGAQKSGTTSLWQYLREHPDVASPMSKEMSYFDVNFRRGPDWYRMHFPLQREVESAAGRHLLTGESSAYYMLHPHAPARIAQMLPQARIILLLRNPVDRAFSHYHLKIRRLQETLSFEDAIDAEPERLVGEEEKLLGNPGYYSAAHDRYSYVTRGIYVDQIRRWEQFFPPERLLILEAGEFFRETAAVYERVLNFLGLPPNPAAQFGNRFPGKYRDRMKDETRRKLTDVFEPHNERLYAHLGVRFDWERRNRAAA
jgi:sulfotransferase family protein